MNRPGTSVNRNTNKSKLGNLGVNLKMKQWNIPSYKEFLNKNDWIGAIAMIDFDKSLINEDKKFWKAYFYFHSGEY